VQGNLVCGFGGDFVVRPLSACAQCEWASQMDCGRAQNFEENAKKALQML